MENTSKELVSVIMTVYNSEKYLNETIQSILNQTYSNIEFIIVNDESLDTSLDIIKSYQKKDKRIKIINKGKLGRGRALNSALEKCKGDYIVNIDSDDPSLSNRIEVQKKFLDQNRNIVLVGSDSYVINESGKIIKKIKFPKNYIEIKNAMARCCPFNHSSVMFRRKEILKLGGYSETLLAQLDYDLWIKILQNYKAVNLDQILATKRIHQNQFFEGKVIKKNYIQLLKNKIKAIKYLKLSKKNYFFLIHGLVKNYIPRSFKLYLKDMIK